MSICSVHPIIKIVDSLFAVDTFRIKKENLHEKVQTSRLEPTTLEFRVKFRKNLKLKNPSNNPIPKPSSQFLK